MSYPVPAGIADVTVITSYHGREVMEMAYDANEPRDWRGRWYHGTASRLKPGDYLEPERMLGAKRGKGMVFFTSSKRAAANYGRFKADALRAGYGDTEARGRVYEVEPTGPVEKDDTIAEQFEGYRSRYPARVVREVRVRYEPQ